LQVRLKSASRTIALVPRGRLEQLLDGDAIDSERPTGGPGVRGNNSGVEPTGDAVPEA
jgi:hypothetical protein